MGSGSNPFVWHVAFDNVRGTTTELDVATFVGVTPAAAGWPCEWMPPSLVTATAMRMKARIMELSFVALVGRRMLSPGFGCLGEPGHLVS
jgi:hypothetical protein